MDTDLLKELSSVLEKLSLVSEYACSFNKKLTSLKVDYNYIPHDSYDYGKYCFDPNGKCGCIFTGFKLTMSMYTDRIIWIEGITQIYGRAIIVMGFHEGSLLSRLIYEEK